MLRPKSKIGSQKNLDKKHLHDSPASLLPHDYDKLSVKLGQHDVTERSLQYVHDLWKYIAQHLLELPNLDAVLYDIQDGCILVTWLIPAALNAATRISSRILRCQDFVAKSEIVEMMISEKQQVPT